MKRSVITKKQKITKPSFEGRLGFVLRLRMTMRRSYCYALRDIRRKLHVLKYHNRKRLLRARYHIKKLQWTIASTIFHKHAILHDIRVVRSREMLHLRTKGVLLIIMFCISSISGYDQKRTLSFFSDVEAAPNNSYGAAVLDIAVAPNELSGTEVSSEKSVKRDITLTNEGVLPVHFDASALYLEGPEEACTNAIILTLKDENNTVLGTGPVGSFHIPTQTLAIQGSKTFTLEIGLLSQTDEEDRAQCSFDMLWHGWQTDIQGYDVLVGYTDEERFDSMVTLRIPQTEHPGTQTLVRQERQEREEREDREVSHAENDLQLSDTEATKTDETIITE